MPRQLRNRHAVLLQDIADIGGNGVIDDPHRQLGSRGRTLEQDADEIVHRRLQRIHAGRGAEIRVHRPGIVEDDHHLQRARLKLRVGGDADRARPDAENLHERHRKLGRGGHGGVDAVGGAEHRRRIHRTHAQKIEGYVAAEIAPHLHAAITGIVAGGNVALAGVDAECAGAGQRGGIDAGLHLAFGDVHAPDIDRRADRADHRDQARDHHRQRRAARGAHQATAR